MGDKQRNDWSADDGGFSGDSIKTPSPSGRHGLQAGMPTMFAPPGSQQPRGHKPAGVAKAVNQVSSTRIVPGSSFAIRVSVKQHSHQHEQDLVKHVDRGGQWSLPQTSQATPQQLSGSRRLEHQDSLRTLSNKRTESQHFQVPPASSSSLSGRGPSARQSTKQQSLPLSQTSATAAKRAPAARGRKPVEKKDTVVDLLDDDDENYHSQFDGAANTNPNNNCIGTRIPLNAVHFGLLSCPSQMGSENSLMIHGGFRPGKWAITWIRRSDPVTEEFRYSDIFNFIEGESPDGEKLLALELRSGVMLQNIPVGDSFILDPTNIRTGAVEKYIVLSFTAQGYERLKELLPADTKFLTTRTALWKTHASRNVSQNSLECLCTRMDLELSRILLRQERGSRIQTNRNREVILLSGNEPVDPTDNITYVVYPTDPEATDAITISLGDMKRLQPCVYFNDNLIDLKIKHLLLQLQDTNPILRSRIHAFSCHFYAKLTETSKAGDAHSLVAKWTKSVDLFDRDFVLFPINLHNHWSLMVLARPGLMLQWPQIVSDNDVKVEVKNETAASDTMVMDVVEEDSNTDKKTINTQNLPCFLHLDSLRMHPTKTIADTLARYMWYERKRRVLDPKLEQEQQQQQGVAVKKEGSEVVSSSSSSSSPSPAVNDNNNINNAQNNNNQSPSNSSTHSSGSTATVEVDVASNNNNNSNNSNNAEDDDNDDALISSLVPAAAPARATAAPAAVASIVIPDLLENTPESVVAAAASSSMSTVKYGTRRLSRNATPPQPQQQEQQPQAVDMASSPSPAKGKRGKNGTNNSSIKDADSLAVDVFVKSLPAAVKCAVPMQQNGYDCGVFVIRFAEMILDKQPSTSASDLAEKLKSQFFAEFTQGDIDCERVKLRSFLESLRPEWLEKRDAWRKQCAAEGKELPRDAVDDADMLNADKLLAEQLTLYRDAQQQHQNQQTMQQDEEAIIVVGSDDHHAQLQEASSTAVSSGESGSLYAQLTSAATSVLHTVADAVSAALTPVMKHHEKDKKKPARLYDAMVAEATGSASPVYTMEESDAEDNNNNDKNDDDYKKAASASHTPAKAVATPVHIRFASPRAVSPQPGAADGHDESAHMVATPDGASRSNNSNSSSARKTRSRGMKTMLEAMSGVEGSSSSSSSSSGLSNTKQLLMHAERVMHNADQVVQQTSPGREHKKTEQVASDIEEDGSDDVSEKEDVHSKSASKKREGSAPTDEQQQSAKRRKSSQR